VETPLVLLCDHCVGQYRKYSLRIKWYVSQTHTFQGSHAIVN